MNLTKANIKALGDDFRLYYRNVVFRYGSRYFYIGCRTYRALGKGVAHCGDVLPYYRLSNGYG